MAPIAFARVAILALLALAFTAGSAAARNLSVWAKPGTGEVKITNIRTGETRTGRILEIERGHDRGEAVFRRVPGGIYKVEAPGTRTQYVTVVVTVVDEPGLITEYITLDEIAPGDPDRALEEMEPNIRESVQRALDRAPTPADKEKALQERARKVEEHLKRALVANEETPGLVNIAVIVQSLNAIQRLRAHYLAQPRPATPDFRQGDIRQWSWENPFASYAGLLAGAERLELSQVGIGTVVSGGEERALLRSDDHATGASVGAQISYPLDGFDWKDGYDWSAQLVASYSYLDASGTDKAEVPVGTFDTAITYHRPAPNSSTGLFLGGTGLSASQKVDVDAHRVTVGLAGHLPLSSDQRFFFVPFVGLKYEHFKQTYEGTLQSLTFNDIRSTTVQKITQTLLGPSLGGYLFWVPGDSTRLTIGGKLDLFHSWDDLESRQHNICGGCGPDEDDYEVEIDDDDSYWTYRLDLRAELEHKLAYEHLSLGLYAGVRVLGDRAGVRNPENPAQPAPHLTSASASDLYGGVNIRFRF